MKVHIGYAFGAFNALLLIIGGELADADWWWWLIAVVFAAIGVTALRQWDYAAARKRSDVGNICGSSRP